MDDLYKPIDFSAISGYPHLIPEKAIENLPCFQNDNVIPRRECQLAQRGR
jgi:hypothetical protein